MSRKCFYCKKKPVVGMTVSHSMNHTKRMFNPNLQNVNIIVKGKKVKKLVCTKCLKAGKAQKALAK